MGSVTHRFNHIKLYHIICSTPVFPCFSVLPGLAAQLATLAANRLLQGFRPSTLKQYDRMWRDFIAYQVAAGLPPCEVNTEILLSFMEFLHHNSLSSSHIENYMAALRGGLSELLYQKLNEYTYKFTWILIIYIYNLYKEIRSLVYLCVTQ